MVWWRAWVPIIPLLLIPDNLSLVITPPGPLFFFPPQIYKINWLSGEILLALKSVNCELLMVSSV